MRTLGPASAITWKAYLQPPEPDPQRDNPTAGLDERGIIASILARARPGPLWVGPGDDGAVLLDGTTLTVDALIEGVHFDDRLGPADVGFKAIAVSASDVASMGATPTWALLALSLPNPADPAWVESLGEGLAEACSAFGAPLVGGDTTRSPGPRMVTVAMGGKLVGERPLTRAGAKPGATLWVTGELGLAGAGWRDAAPSAAALAALRRPRPPTAFAADLARAGLAQAAMDLSDGLWTDLGRLAAASGLRAELAIRSLPIAAALAGRHDATELALHGGEDYGLLFATAADRHPAVIALGEHHGVRLTAIGRLTAGAGVHADHPVSGTAFRHFGSPEIGS